MCRMAVLADTIANHQGIDGIMYTSGDVPMRYII